MKPVTVTFIIMVALAMSACFYQRRVVFTDGPKPEQRYERKCVDEQIELAHENYSSHSEEENERIFYESIEQCEVWL